MKTPFFNNVDIYDSKEINFIKIFHRILILFSVIVILCLFIIPVNYSVGFKSGAVISRNPQIDYKAPFEVITRKVFVQKGDQVKKGDTLIIIDNAGLDKDFSATQGQYVSLEQQDKTIDIDKLNIDEKIAYYTKEKELNDSQNNFNINSIYSSIRSLRAKADLLRQQDRLKYNKLRTDTIMYQKDVISLIELNNAQSEYLNIRNQVLSAQSEINALQNQLNVLKNEYQQKDNALEIQISDLKASSGRLDQQKEDVSSKLESQGKSVDFMKSEIDKQYLIATIDGVVNSIYNEDTSFNFINKGESLLTISPIEETFYARAQIDEQFLKYLQKGQQANLKFDAYNYYQYGAVKGALSFIPDRKEEDGNFYVLIDIPEKEGFNLRSGYAFKGDIILQKMRLGRYIFKKLFEKYDNQVAEEKPKMPKEAKG